MLRTTIVGLGWRGNTLVKATRAFGVPLNLSTGDSTTALIELESGAAGARHHDQHVLRLVARDLPHELPRRKRKRNMHDRVRRRARFGGDRQAARQPSRPQSRLFRQGRVCAEHLSDPPNGILQTVAASEAVLKSVDVYGAWITV